MIVDHLASLAVAGFQRVHDQGSRPPRGPPVCQPVPHARGRWPQGPTDSVATSCRWWSATGWAAAETHSAQMNRRCKRRISG